MCLAMDISNPARKKALLLHFAGVEVFELCQHLPPTTVEGDEYKKVVSQLNDYFVPKKNVDFECDVFRHAFQEEGESMDVYVARLRKLAATCEFADVDRELRQQIITGVRDFKVREKALQKRLTLQELLDQAKSTEQAKRQAKEMGQHGGACGTSQAVHQTLLHRGQVGVRPGQVGVKPADGGKPQLQVPSGRCYRCLSPRHTAGQCPFLRKTCFACGQVGHTQAACRNVNKSGQTSVDREKEKWRPSMKAGQNSSKWGKKKVKQVREDEQDSEQYSMFHAKVCSGSPKPIMTDLHVNGKTVAFEVDTGASLTVMTADQFQKLWPNATVTDATEKLASYTGESIPVVGKKQVEVRCQKQNVWLPLLVVEGRATNRPLLGRNWLAEVKLNWKTLFNLSSQASESRAELLDEFPELTSPGLGCTSKVASLDVDLNMKPIFYKARPVPLALKPMVEAELERQIQSGVLRPVESAEWAAPMVTILKRDQKSVRLCGSYNLTVNKVSKLQQYPLPKVEELLTKLAGGEKFTKIDLREAYLQVPLDEASQKYTVINTHRGLLATTRLVYGIASAPAIFQRLMENVLTGLPQVAVFLDDICITGKDDAEHKANVREVLRRLAKEGLKINPGKCEWMLPTVTYLGFRIDKEGLHPTSEKVRAVKDAPCPQNVEQLKAYLGLLSYYSRFLSNMAATAAPLYKLLKADEPWMWTDEQEQAFKATKDLLCKAPCLSHFDARCPVVVAADASPYGLGAVLSIVTREGEKPVAYASRSLSKAERNYSQIDKEGLGLVYAVKKFHPFVYGRPFVLKTDHRPLLGLLGSKKPLPDAVSPRVVRWKVTLDAYQFDLVHVPGREHGNCDALSRLPLPAAPSTVPEVGEVIHLLNEVDNKLVRLHEVRAWTRRDPVVSQVVRFAQTYWPCESPKDPALQPYATRQNELTSEQGCLLWGSRLVIPAPGRQRVLRLLHDGHPGMSAMKALARSKLWWPGLDADVEEFVRCCSTCQLHRNKLPPEPAASWQQPKGPWCRIHLDYAGPVEGKMLLVIVDAYSKWPEVWITLSTSAQVTIDHLRMSFATHGLPEVVVSDNAGCFAGEEFRTFLACNGIRQRFTPPRHPASNGEAENVVKIVKMALKKRAGSLLVRLTRWLYHYRNLPHSATGQTPAELLLRRKPRTHFDMMLSEGSSASSDGVPPSRSFVAGDPVFVTEIGGSVTRWLPATVTAVDGRVVIVRLRDGREFRRHVDHVRARTRSLVTEPGGQQTAVPEPVQPTQTADDPGAVPESRQMTPTEDTRPFQEVLPVPAPVPAVVPASVPATDPASAAVPALIPAEVPTVLRRSTRVRRAPDRLNL